MTTTKLVFSLGTLTFTGLLTAAVAHADPVASGAPAAPTPTIAAPAATGVVPAPAAPPPPYSLPWQLRPAAVGNVVRLDNSVALYQNPAGESGETVSSMLLATFKISPSFAPLLRMGVVQNNNPGTIMGSGSAFLNPVVGMTYGHKLSSDFRMSALLGVTLPLGSSGDKAATKDEGAAALAAGIKARSAMDNAMFAVNYMTVVAGADVAYVAHKLTIQGEFTILQLMRVRNDDISTDSKNTNSTVGLHVGYFLAPFVSLGTEIRYQRWLSTPIAVEKDMTGTLRDTATVAFGPRFHFKVGNSTWLRPGISYSRGLDNPLSDAKYSIVQIDVPVAF